MQCRIRCADAAANGFYDCYCHAVACLLVCLRIRIDGEDLINLILDIKNAGILPFEVGKGAVLPGMQTSGVRRDLRITFRQIYKVESGLSAGVLRAGDPGRIIDSFAQPSMDDLYKSFCICSKDRKYFSGASGIKISDKEQPPS